MANNTNTWSEDDSAQTSPASMRSSPTSQKTKLSKQSREFKMPTHSSPVSKGSDDKILRKKEKTARIVKTKTSESDFSTEGSDTEHEVTSMKLSSSSFYLKSASAPPKNGESPDGKTGNPDYLLDRNKLLNDRDDQSKLCSENLTKISSTWSHKDISDKDNCTHTHKPTRRKQHRKDKKRFVESYKAKKKTEICKNWESTGRCKFGDACAFAHGHEELMVKNNLPMKYKTKVCRQFHEEGYCRYGNRCQFIHRIIQKDIQTFNYSDILKESLYQFESRSKSKNFPLLEDQMINTFKTKRLAVFKDLAPETDKESGNSDKEIPRVWDLQKASPQQA